MVASIRHYLETFNFSISVRSLSFLYTIIFFILASCEKEDEGIPQEITSPTENQPGLVETLESEYTTLSTNPLDWSDSELSFLDNLADKRVIGLGEATHGTAEFFDSKFRLFKYMVENHGFRVFAIEADFGESFLINEAIQNGATDEVVDLMRSTMIFWTWRTEEVRAMLEWMAEYNQAKNDNEKLQYIGVDTQFNRYNVDLLIDYLEQSEVSFLSFARGILQEAKTASENSLETYDQARFSSLMNQLHQVRDSIQFNESVFTNKNSEDTYKLHLRLAEVIRQSTQVIYARTNNDRTVSYRDQYMAENTLWASEFFDDAPVVLWAHNAHVAKDPLYGGAGGAIGRQLQQQIGAGYYTIGFLFAQGSFNAVTAIGNQFANLEQQRITVAPKAKSLNSIMSRAEASIFHIALPQLNQYEVWGNAYANSMEYFHIGSIYNNNPMDYYLRFNPVYYDKLIFFENTEASDLIPIN